MLKTSVAAIRTTTMAAGRRRVSVVGIIVRGTVRLNVMSVNLTTQRAGDVPYTLLGIPIGL